MSASRSSIRLWPALVIVVLLGAFLAWHWVLPASDETTRQGRVMATGSALIVAGIALGLWWTFASRIRWRSRLLGWAAVAAVVAGFFALYRYEGVTGDLIPVFEYRWSGEGELARGAAPSQPSSDELAFPQFRGPNRDGVVPDPGLVTDWEASPPKMIWRRPVGTAWSGFAIAGGRAITQEQQGSQECVVCYDLMSGEEVWTVRDDVEYRSGLAGDGPRATPTIVGDRVYTLGAKGFLNAIRVEDGERLWSLDILEDNDGLQLDWGISGSPLFDEGRVVVAPGGKDGALLAAYDADTGERLWRAGSDWASYGSPRRVNLAGRDQIVSINHSSVTGHDPKSGEVLWSHPFPARNPNVAMPLPIDADRLLVSSGYGIGSKMYRIENRDGVFEAELLWESRHLRSKFANLLFIDGFIYGLNDGMMVCLDPEDGRSRWPRSREGDYGHGQLLQVGRRILVQTEEGEVILIDPSPDELKEITRFQALEGKVWNPPALAGALLLVRSDREAVLYELPVVEAR